MIIIIAILVSSLYYSLLCFELNQNNARNQQKDLHSPICHFTLHQHHQQHYQYTKSKRAIFSFNLQKKHRKHSIYPCYQKFFSLKKMKCFLKFKLEKEPLALSI